MLGVPKKGFLSKWSVRKALNDLITDLHNSNRPLVQVTLSGEELVEERFFLLGFVAGKDIKIEENVWFSELTVFQICLLDEVLAKKQILIMFW